MRVKRDAMTADARSRIKRHKAERLGRGGADDFPRVDAERVADLCHLVRHSDIDGAESVFPELRRFGNSRARNRMNVFDNLRIKKRGDFGRIKTYSADDFRDIVRLK